MNGFCICMRSCIFTLQPDYEIMKHVMHLLFFVLSALPAAAQSDSSSVRELRAVTDRLFDAMRTGDSTGLHALFLPDAHLRTTFFHNESGGYVVYEENLQEFLDAIGTPHDGIWDERTAAHRYLIDASLAQVWMDYSFYFNGTFSHCGVNSFQLILTPGGWKISDITDTRRTENCNSKL